MAARISVVAAINAGYALLAARELWLLGTIPG
jgi:hypothetical protein